MKPTILFLFFFISFCCQAQIQHVYTGKTDSVVIKSFSFYDKETSTINDTIQGSKIELINSKKLTINEINSLYKKLKSIKSYSKKRALLSHFDIKLFFYFNGRIIQDITYSSITHNLTIYTYEKCTFKGKATPYLEKEIKRH